MVFLKIKPRSEKCIVAASGFTRVSSMGSVTTEYSNPNGDTYSLTLSRAEIQGMLDEMDDMVELLMPKNINEAMTEFNVTLSELIS